MKKYALAALLAAVVLVLASCGDNPGGGENQNNVQSTSSEESKAQTSQQTSKEETAGEGMAGMDQSGMNGDDMASEDMVAMSREMVAPNGEYSDKAFIDAMVPHHEGAVEMAQVALQRAEHAEITNLAKEIVGAQRAEIELFGEIREREYGAAESTMGMNEQDMEAMGMSDSEALANAEPFDKAFIDEMIPHHESAIAMAEIARQETNDPSIREIAADIVTAQKREIEQMKQWRQQWYPEG